MAKRSRSQMSRRDFLIGSSQTALMLTALDTVLGSFLFGQKNLALAQATKEFKNFIYIDFYGSPPRWMFDLFLNPSNSPNFLRSPMVTNRYSSSANGRYETATYSQVLYKPNSTTQVYVPYLWSQDVAAPTGTVRASSLLQHMYSVRGIDVLNAAHDGASRFHKAAILGQPTITSHTADRGKPAASNPTANLIRAIHIDPNPGSIFQSQHGYPAFSHGIPSITDQQISDKKSDQLTPLFRSLQPVSNANGFSNVFVANNGHLDDRIDAALKSLKTGDPIYYQSLVDDNERAMSILTDQTISTFSQLATDWEGLFGKYLSLIERTLGQTYTGLNDKPVGRTNIDDANKVQYQAGQEMFALPKNNSNDLRTIVRNAKANRLAAQFAVVEFLVTKGLCSSVSIFPGRFDNNSLMINGAPADIPFDQHYHGSMIGVLVNSMYYLAFTSCLIELTQALKKAKQFNDTLIYMASEFNRSARKDGSGSDHGAAATSVSLISGGISSFKVIGNIYKDSAGQGLGHDTRYAGTWGVGAPISGNGTLNIVQFWGSIMRLLGATEIPNAVDQTNLIFNTPGSFVVKDSYNQANNIDNKSK